MLIKKSGKCWIIYHGCVTVLVCFNLLPFPLCAIHFTFQTNIKNSFYSGIPSNIHTSILTHICDQKIKNSKLITVIGTIQQICFTCVFIIQSHRWWHQMCSLKAGVENREGGLRRPPERECWLIYQKGCDWTISKIRVRADHSGGAVIPDWTNQSHSHTLQLF